MIDGAGGGETLPRHPASKARHLLLGEKAWGWHKIYPTKKRAWKGDFHARFGSDGVSGGAGRGWTQPKPDAAEAGRSRGWTQPGLDTAEAGRSRGLRRPGAMRQTGSPGGSAII